MVFNFTSTTGFYFYHAPVDMRKCIHSLYHIIKTSGDLDVLNGDGFVFPGRTRKSLKILRWQNEGFILYNKKLELGRYNLPHQPGEGVFFELKSDILDQTVNSVKQKSSFNELRLKEVLRI